MYLHIPIKDGYNLTEKSCLCCYFVFICNKKFTHSPVHGVPVIKKITVVQFRVRSGSGFITGSEVLQMHHYDPEICSIVVDEKGTLRIRQIRHGEVTFRKQFWELVHPEPQVIPEPGESSANED